MNQLWRTALGAAIIAAVWVIWSLAVMVGAIATGLVKREAFAALFGLTETNLSYSDALAVLLVALASLWGFSLGAWLAIKGVHRRRFTSVLSSSGRLDMRQMAVGGGLAVVYLLASFALSVASGNAPRRSGLDVGAWLMALGPIAIVIFTQAASEELIFRGYLPQQLASRSTNALVWGLAPSVLFGLMHAGNAPGSSAYAAYYVVIATVMGLVMMAMVWRTGSLAAAIGFHFINNLGALTLAGSDAGGSSLALYVWSSDELMRGASGELLLVGALLAFVLSPFAPLPKGQALARRK